MPDALEFMPFRDIPPADPFFDSLKRDYQEFPEWYAKKATEKAYVQHTGGRLIGFMYPKLEVGPIEDVTPNLPKGRHIKIGTFKVEAHGTKLGERLLKKALDHAIVYAADDVYVTIFPRHQPLIDLLQGFGFEEHGFKTTTNGTETVLLKRLQPPPFSGDPRNDYPLVDATSGHFYLLSIYPMYHSQLFPDSILTTESYDLLSDVSHTNSISKTYICAMEGVSSLAAGDKLVIYRTSDGQGPAEYRSVVTSVCVVEESRERRSFANQQAYLRYTRPHSVLSETDLKIWWHKSNMCVIKMLYNAAMTKKLIRRRLADEVGLDRQARWSFLPVSRSQFLSICELGGVSERLVVR